MPVLLITSAVLYQHLEGVQYSGSGAVLADLLLSVVAVVFTDGLKKWGTPMMAVMLLARQAAETAASTADAAACDSASDPAAREGPLYCFAWRW